MPGLLRTMMGGGGGAGVSRYHAAGHVPRHTMPLGEVGGFARPHHIVQRHVDHMCPICIQLSGCPAYGPSSTEAILSLFQGVQIFDEQFEEALTCNADGLVVLNPEHTYSLFKPVPGMCRDFLDLIQIICYIIAWATWIICNVGFNSNNRGVAAGHMGNRRIV